jgi:hypothetical protein
VSNAAHVARKRSRDCHRVRDSQGDAPASVSSFHAIYQVLAESDNGLRTTLTPRWGTVVFLKVGSGRYGVGMET